MFEVKLFMQKNLTQVQPSLDKLTRSLKTATQNLAMLAGLVDCAPFHRRYMEVIDVTCRKAL